MPQFEFRRAAIASMKVAVCTASMQLAIAEAERRSAFAPVGIVTLLQLGAKHTIIGPIGQKNLSGKGQTMPDRWLGIVVASDKITMVDVEVPETGRLIIQADNSWPLQKGDRAAAYKVMHQRVADYAKEHNIGRVVIKSSAVSLGGTKKSHLEAAELRGVIMSAAAEATQTMCLAKSKISKTFGKRKVDEYIADEGFWDAEFSGRLRAGSREAAMILLAARGVA